MTSLWYPPYMTRFSLSKKYVRNIAMVLLALFVLLGVARACFFSVGKTKVSHYLIARTINWSGFPLVGAEADLHAFAEEVVLAASQESNLRIQFVPADPNTLLEDVEDEKFDAIFTFLIPDSFNQYRYQFSDPLYLMGSVLVVRNELTHVNDLSGMDGKLVGVEANSPALLDLARYPSIIVLTYDNIHQALNDVAYDKIDGVIMDSWNAHVYAQGIYAGKIRVATHPFTNDGLRLLTMNDPEHKEFMKRFDDGLERIKASGKYHELLKKWELYNLE
jgi:polar amino acid transport system substrate-binding protein